MAIKASSFYPLTTLFWTLQTGIGKKWQALGQKFHFSPLTYTHSRPKNTGAQKRTHFSNFWGVGCFGVRILCQDSLVFLSSAQFIL